MSPAIRGADSPVEGHYLALNGSTAWGYADGGATGYTTDYALVLKVQNYTTGTAFARFGALVDSGTTDYGYVTADIWVDVAPTPDKVSGSGRLAAGSVQWQSTAYDLTSIPQVLAVSHNLTANTARFRQIRSSDASILASYDSASGLTDRAPDTVVVGTMANGDNVVKSFYCNFGLVAACFLASTPTDAELQAYSGVRDARLVWDSAKLKGYWPASALSGTSGANLAGSVPLTYANATAANLVSF